MIFDWPNLLIGALVGWVAGFLLDRLVLWSRRVRVQFKGFEAVETNFGRLYKIKFSLRGYEDPGDCCCELQSDGYKTLAKWDEMPNPLQEDRLDAFVPELVPQTFFQKLYVGKEYAVPVLVNDSRNIYVFDGWWFGKDKGYYKLPSLNELDSVRVILRGSGFRWDAAFTVSGLISARSSARSISFSFLGQYVRSKMGFLLTYKKRIARALGVFLFPSFLWVLPFYAAAYLFGRELFSELPVTDGKDYLTILLAGAALFTALASVEAQIYTNLNKMIDELQERQKPVRSEKRKTVAPVVRAREFTWRGGWMFAHAVPPILVLLVVQVFGWNFFGKDTCVAALQYLVFILFVLGWLCLIAATLRKPLDRR
jgi:hypothetical protein